VAARAEVTIERPADVVWGVIGDFGDVGWIPNAHSLELDGDVRAFQLGSSVVRHRLVRLDEIGRSYTYALAGEANATNEAVPATEAMISVVADGPSVSTVTWTSETDERRGSAEGLQAFFQGILDHLKSQLELVSTTSISVRDAR